MNLNQEIELMLAFNDLQALNFQLKTTLSEINAKNTKKKENGVELSDKEKNLVESMKKGISDVSRIFIVFKQLEKLYINASQRNTILEKLILDMKANEIKTKTEFDQLINRNNRLLKHLENI